MLNLTESLKFLKEKNLPMARYRIVLGEEDLDKLDFPIFLKAAEVLHKTEEKAVVKCKNLQEAKETYYNFKQKFPKSAVVMQEEISGVEFIIGLKQDRVFGKVLMIGFGGTFTEIVKDVSFRVLPVEKSELEKMIKELKLYDVLHKRKKFAISKLVELLEKVSLIENEISEMDLNPVIVTEKEALIVDARINLN